MGDLDFDVRIKTKHQAPAALMSEIGQAMAHGTFRVPARLPSDRPLVLAVVTRSGEIALKGKAEVLGYEGTSTWVRFLSATDEGSADANLVLQDVEVELAPERASTRAGTSSVIQVPPAAPAPLGAATAAVTRRPPPPARGSKAPAAVPRVVVPPKARGTDSHTALSGSRTDPPAPAASSPPPLATSSDAAPQPGHPAESRRSTRLPTASLPVRAEPPRTTAGLPAVPEPTPIEPEASDGIPLPVAAPHPPRDEATRALTPRRPPAPPRPGRPGDPAAITARIAQPQLEQATRACLPADDEPLGVVAPAAIAASGELAAPPPDPGATAPQQELARVIAPDTELEDRQLTPDASPARVVADERSSSPAPPAPTIGAYSATVPALAPSKLAPPPSQPLAAISAPQPPSPSKLAPPPSQPLPPPPTPGPALSSVVAWWSQPAVESGGPPAGAAPGLRGAASAAASGFDSTSPPVHAADSVVAPPTQLTPRALTERAWMGPPPSEPLPRLGTAPLLDSPAAGMTDRALTQPPGVSDRRDDIAALRRSQRRVLAAAIAIAGSGVAVAAVAIGWAVTRPTAGAPAALACGPTDSLSSVAATQVGSSVGATVAAAAAGAPLPAAPPTAPQTGAGCQLRVSSNASLAEVWIDGARKGLVSELIDVPCRPFQLGLRHPRYAAATRALTPSAGANELAVKLTRPMVTVKIQSTPPGATARVNGREVGKTPIEAKVYAFERGTIVLSHNGGAIKTMQIYPQADNTVFSAVLPKPLPKPRSKSRR